MPPLLWALVALWGLLLFGGAALGRWNTERTHRMPTWARMASSFALVLLAWALSLISEGGAVESYSLLIALGMTLGFVGDLFMARLLPVREPVLGGIGAFALGHIIYIAAILGLGDGLELTAPAPRLGAWLGLLVVGAVSWYLVVWRGARQKSVLHIAALPYALLLASTTGFGLGLALQDASIAPLALGGMLFLASDLLLAAQLFNGLHFTSIGDVIWLTYGPAQMLIVTSVLAAGMRTA
jgi:uncharacterized membrane protein YhhN